MCIQEAKQSYMLLLHADEFSMAAADWFCDTYSTTAVYSACLTLTSLLLKLGNFGAIPRAFRHFFACCRCWCFLVVRPKCIWCNLPSGAIPRFYMITNTLYGRITDFQQNTRNTFIVNRGTYISGCVLYIFPDVCSFIWKTHGTDWSGFCDGIPWNTFFVNMSTPLYECINVIVLKKRVSGRRVHNCIYGSCSTIATKNTMTYLR